VTLSLPDNLQGAFVSSQGAPIPFGDEQIVQGDRWELDAPAVLELRFLGEPGGADQAVRISAKKRGTVQLTDGQKVRVLEVSDESGLPRFVRHPVDPKGEPILIYNSYTVERGAHSFQESWTGNAGMIVTEQTPTSRLYECSSGIGPFNRNDLRFEISILPADAPWMPKDIYE
jgi:hypothetical protein